MKLSIIIPAKNEEVGLERILPKLKSYYPNDEIIVVNDGSTDNSSGICQKYEVIEIKHHYSKGNGAAIKSGVRASTGDYLVFMDADGQHNPDDISLLIEKILEGYDMVVGARISGSQASLGRGVANGIYNRIASYMTGQKIDDLTSGFRIAKAEYFKKFINLLPNGFSYPTTSTMAFFRAGYSVSYIPIIAEKREGKSHIKPVRDGVRFLLIIFKIGTLYSPLKIFFPMSFFILVLGLSYYGYTFVTESRFTNMSALMFTTSLIVFMVGLVSEQITALLYKDSDN